MGQKLTQYDHELRKRLEESRKKQRITQEEMAKCMGVTIERYKRYAYGESKIPVEKLATLFERLPVDPDYILLGKDNSVMRVLGYVQSSNDMEKSNFFFELSKLYKRKHEMKSADFITDDGMLIETKKKKSDK